MSWKPVVKVIGESGWHKNGLVFATKEEAEANASDLMRRWLMVTEAGAEESVEPVNYRWEDGKLVNVETNVGVVLPDRVTL